MDNQKNQLLSESFEKVSEIYRKLYYEHKSKENFIFESYLLCQNEHFP